MNEVERIDQKWLKAAVIGSVWAAFEIIVGSFLHNLRIPFTGMLMSAASVFLLVSFLHLWKEKGIILRAGIVCALMKSISPSAIILGPMVGIFMEALILEGTTRLIGRNAIGFILAGALAVLWTLIQKILNLLVLYGLDLVKIAETLYQYLVKLTGFTTLSFSSLFIWIALFYSFIGAFVALGGILTGRKYIKQEAKMLPYLELKPKNQLFGLDENQTYSFRNLFLIVAAIVLNLFLINKKLHLLALFSGVGFLVFCFLRYKNAMRPLQKPGIWIQFGLITLIAAFLWEWISEGSYFSTKGLLIGLEMNFRALIIIFGFMAIGVELRNPLIKTLLFRNGFSNLYSAMNLAFSALPSLIEQLPKPKNILIQRQGLVFQLLAQSEILLEKFASQSLQTPVFIISGKVHEGKTTFMEKVAELLIEDGSNVSGFLSRGLMLNGERQSYVLHHLGTLEEIPLASAVNIEGWKQFRRFWFNPEAFITGNRWLKDACEQECDCIVIDEIGPMELADEGWAQSLDLLKDKKDCFQFWIVRENVVDAVVKKWNITDYQLIKISETEPKKFALSIIAKKRWLNHG